MLPELDAVTTSYHRCMHSGGFTDTFYLKFLAKGPEIAAKFSRTDFDHQKRMLRQSLLLMVMYNYKPDSALPELERLAERHSRRGVDIPDYMYDLWLDALCEAVGEHDPEWEYDEQLAEHWRAAMRPGIELILSRR